MHKNTHQFIMEILKFIYMEGGCPQSWCVDVTKESGEQLFEEYYAYYQNGSWLYRITSSESEALQVKSYFLEYGLKDDDKEWQPGACAICVCRKQMELVKKAKPKVAGKRKIRQMMLCSYS